MSIAAPDTAGRGRLGAAIVLALPSLAAAQVTPGSFRGQRFRAEAGESTRSACKYRVSGGDDHVRDAARYRVGLGADAAAARARDVTKVRARARDHDDNPLWSPFCWEAFDYDRATYCGRVVHYLTYDASGDENDINIDMEPLPGYEQYASSDPANDACHYDMQPTADVAGCLTAEVTPDNDVLEYADADYLPIRGANGNHNDWLAPGSADLAPVFERRFDDPLGDLCVYGMNVVDTCHGSGFSRGWYEIHPIDALWWYDAEPVSGVDPRWAYAVFADDSNRFGATWAVPPRDVMLSFPFYVPAASLPICAYVERFEARPFDDSETSSNTRHGSSEGQTLKPVLTGSSPVPVEPDNVSTATTTLPPRFSERFELGGPDGITVIEDYPADLDVRIDGCVQQGHAWGDITVRVVLDGDPDDPEGMYYGQIRFGACES